MRIAVCDDDEICRKNISNLLNMYSQKNPQYEIVFSVFDHADDLLAAAKKTGGFDIYILDVLMPDTNGVELGIMLRDNGYDGKIIYFTSSGDYVFDSFRTQPFNYIVKPVETDKLFKVLDAAADVVSYKKEKSIIVKTSDGSIKLPHDNIIYAELVNRSVVYHLINGKAVESNTIHVPFREEIKSLSEDEHFVMCGASVIVNLLHVTAFKTQELTFRDGSRIHLSRKLLSGFGSRWLEYWLDGHDN